MKKVVKYFFLCVLLVVFAVCMIIILAGSFLIFADRNADDKDISKETAEEVSEDADRNTDTGVYEESLTEYLHQEAQVQELDIQVMENREDEMVFSFSIDDFIDSYNGYYWQDKNVRYLLPSLEWRAYLYDTAVHSRHRTSCCIFSKDETMPAFPTITVYVPSNGSYVQEITVDFDDHSYMDSLYNIYEEQCFYTLKVMFPDLADETITNLYTTLNQLAYDNVTTVKYTSDSVPCALYYRGGIGIYPYFALGESVHLCMIPVTQQYLDEMREKGVTVNEIQ